MDPKSGQFIYNSYLKIRRVSAYADDVVILLFMLKFDNVFLDINTSFEVFSSLSMAFNDVRLYE